MNNETCYCINFEISNGAVVAILFHQQVIECIQTLQLNLIQTTIEFRYRMFDWFAYFKIMSSNWMFKFASGTFTTHRLKLQTNK